MPSRKYSDPAGKREKIQIKLGHAEPKLQSVISRSAKQPDGSSSTFDNYRYPINLCVDDKWVFPHFYIVVPPVDTTAPDFEMKILLEAKAEAIASALDLAVQNPEWDEKYMGALISFSGKDAMQKIPDWIDRLEAGRSAERVSIDAKS
jgi:hypothetical protein